ncbi:spore coat associated protein CotJA [Orenia marismortui]|uniref:spore coat associated protein CotJA n=1 Tax=Orenia marismortui TaxID=46469 RepID=UPI00036517EC|nr:spore coat associated protein CotJA [Orenia marismortui]
MANRRPNIEREHKPSCDCQLAEACIPFQNYGSRYSPMEALSIGTIFIDLYRPYKRKRI